MYTDEEPASRKLSFAMSGFADSLVPGRFDFFTLPAGRTGVGKRNGGAVGVLGDGLGDGFGARTTRAASLMIHCTSNRLLVILENSKSNSSYRMLMSRHLRRRKLREIVLPQRREYTRCQDIVVRDNVAHIYTSRVFVSSTHTKVSSVPIAPIARAIAFSRRDTDTERRGLTIEHVVDLARWRLQQELGSR